MIENLWDKGERLKGYYGHDSLYSLSEEVEGEDWEVCFVLEVSEVFKCLLFSRLDI